jgi:hypothetical protein
MVHPRGFQVYHKCHIIAEKSVLGCISDISNVRRVVWDLFFYAFSYECQIDFQAARAITINNNNGCGLGPTCSSDEGNKK